MGVFDACHSAGLVVVTSVCDIGANSVKAKKQLDVSGKAPFIRFQYQNTATLFDPPHPFNLLKPNDIYIYIYIYMSYHSANLQMLNFKYLFKYILNILNMLHNLRFFSLQNAVYFIMLPCLVPVLFAFYLQGVLKVKCKIPAPKG